MAAGTYNFVSVTLNVTFVGLLTVATGGFASGPASVVFHFYIISKTILSHQ